MVNLFRPKDNLSCIPFVIDLFECSTKVFVEVDHLFTFYHISL